MRGIFRTSGLMLAIGPVRPDTTATPMAQHGQVLAHEKGAMDRTRGLTIMLFPSLIRTAADFTTNLTAFHKGFARR